MTIRLKNIFTEGHFISKTFSQKDISFQEHFHRMIFYLKNSFKEWHFISKNSHKMTFISRTVLKNDISSQEQF